jgi:hypothetical protein
MKSKAKILMYKKLTKKAFMNLPNNVYLVSNLYWNKDEPVFAEYVVPFPRREQQWKKITDFSVDQRMCHVFKTKKDHERWLRELIRQLS